VFWWNLGYVRLCVQVCVGWIEMSGVWVVVGLGILYPDLILDPRNGRHQGWGTLGMADPGSEGPWEWRTVGVAVMLNSLLN